MYDPIVNNQNDDDIFDDSKTLNDLSSSNNLNDRKKNSDSINNTFEESFNESSTSEERTKRFLKMFGSEAETLMGNLRYQLTAGFYESVSRWLFEYKVDEISYGTYSYLSSLGNKNYPLYHKYYELEIDILKKHIVCSFLKDVFLSEQALKTFNQLNKFFKRNLDENYESNIDQRYVTTYFESLYDILRFTMTQEIGFYKALAKELNLETVDSIIDGTGSVVSLAGSPRRNNLLTETLSPELKKSISDSINKEMGQNGF